MGTQIQEPILFVFTLMLMGGNFEMLKKKIQPLVYVQDDQRIMGISLRYVC